MCLCYCLCLLLLFRGLRRRLPTLSILLSARLAQLVQQCQTYGSFSSRVCAGFYQSRQVKRGVTCAKRCFPVCPGLQQQLSHGRVSFLGGTMQSSEAVIGEYGYARSPTEKHPGDLRASLLCAQHQTERSAALRIVLMVDIDQAHGEHGCGALGRAIICSAMKIILTPLRVNVGGWFGRLPSVCCVCCRHIKTKNRSDSLYAGGTVYCTSICLHS